MTQSIVQLRAGLVDSEALRISGGWTASLTVLGRSEPSDPKPNAEAQFVGRIRRITAARLNLLGLESLVDSLLLIVSEVVTNAVEQAGCDGAGSVTFTQRSLVADFGSRCPTPAAAGPRSRPSARRKRAAGGFTWSPTSPASWVALGDSTWTTERRGLTFPPCPPPAGREVPPSILFFPEAP
ncbi:ATP-binding protein [Streptomyces sp. NPDC054854]